MNNLLDGIITTPLIWSAIGLIVIVLLIAIFCDNGKKGFDTRCIALAGISIGLSLALSLVKIFSLPQGGSVTLASLLPLLIFAYIYGTKKGLMAGIILGLLNFAIEPYAVHPFQVILDYPIAFGAIGLVGMFSKIKPLHKIPQIDFTLGAIVAAFLRFVSHVLSGIFAYETPIWASCAYNSFVFVDIAISVACGILVLSSKTVVRLIEGKQKQAQKQPKGKETDASKKQLETPTEENKKEESK